MYKYVFLGQCNTDESLTPRPELQRKQNMSNPQKATQLGKRKRGSQPPSTKRPAPTIIISSLKSIHLAKFFFVQRPPTSLRTDLSIHNLNSVNLKDNELAMLAKGLSFSPLPTTPLDIQKLQLVQQFDKLTQSLRPIYVHATRKPNTKEIKHYNLTKNHKMYFLQDTKTLKM